MQHVEELQKQASDACLNRVASNTVGVVNSIRTVGKDRVTGRRADGEEVGTGSAGRWGNHHFILTASHVIHPKADASDLRIFWRPTGSIEFRSDAELTSRDIEDAMLIADPNASIHRCSWEDLALIVIDPRAAGAYTEFVDLSKEIFDPPEGEMVHCCGFPFEKNIVVGTQMIGNKEERTLALRSEVFSGRVLPQPTETELRFQITAYKEERHYLIPYNPPDRKHPRGLSGAATWWESDATELVWRPNFRFAGVCTLAYKNGTVLQVLKASVVVRFLEELFKSG